MSRTSVALLRLLRQVVLCIVVVCILCEPVAAQSIKVRVAREYQHQHRRHQKCEPTDKNPACPRNQICDAVKKHCVCDEYHAGENCEKAVLIPCIMSAGQAVLACPQDGYFCYPMHIECQAQTCTDVDGLGYCLELRPLLRGLDDLYKEMKYSTSRHSLGATAYPLTVNQALTHSLAVMPSCEADLCVVALPETASEEVLDVDADLTKFFTFPEIQPNVFRSMYLRTPLAPLQRAYGGLIFAQALAAAEQTVEESFRPHAVHSFFILGADIRYPVDYHVQRTRDGNSFCTRRVDACQRGKIVFQLQASFHVNEVGGLKHQGTMPQVKPPEDCMEIEAAFQVLEAEVEAGLHEARRDRFDNLSYYRYLGYPAHLFECRPVDAKAYYRLADPEHPFKVQNWIKLRKSAGSDPKLNRHLVAFQTDSALINVTCQEHEANGLATTMTTSLDHNVWIHEPELRADEWMLYESRSTIASNGRAFIEAQLWSRDGRLLLSVNQEALVRTADSKAHI